MQFPIFNGLLQSDLDCGGFTLLNLDLTGLNLTKSSVGLGNVDNTSDLLKPVSSATQIALNLKEPTIAVGTSQQFWRGDKVFVNYGALALQNGATTLPLLSVRGASATTAAVLSTQRNDFNAQVALSQLGASTPGNVLIGMLAANVGMLSFEGDTYAVIKSTNTAPLIFGWNGFERMRLMQGLNVGGVGDPGAGCITAYGTIATSHLLASDLTLSGPPGNGVLTCTSATVTANLAVGGSQTIAGSLTVTSNILGNGSISTPNNLVALGFLTIEGNVNFTGLPTSDPHVVGRLWRNSNVLTVSAG